MKSSTFDRNEWYEICNDSILNPFDVILPQKMIKYMNEERRKSILNSLKTWVLLLLFFKVIPIAEGQSNNLDSIKLMGAISLQGNFSHGRLTRSTFVMKVDSDLGNSKWNYTNKLTFMYVDANEKILARDWYSLSVFRFYSNKKKWYPFLIANISTNLRFKLNYRNRYGVGFSYSPYLKNKNFLKINILSLYNYSAFDSEIFVNSVRLGSTREMVRIGIQFLGNIEIVKDKITTIWGSWFLQSLEEKSDYLYRIVVETDIKITEAFSLTSRYRFLYENVYLENLIPTDGLFSVGIKLKFK